MKLVGARLFPIRLMLRRPLANSQQTIQKRSGVLVRLTSDSAHVGWGEATPFPGFGLESSEAATRWLEVRTKALLGTTVDRKTALDLAVDETSPSARGALECALLDLVAREQDVSLRQFLNDGSNGPANSVECNALVGADDLDELEREVTAAWGNGFRTFKIKVGILDLDREVAKVRRLRQVLGDNAKIRLDANQAYTPNAARAALAQFAEHQIEYIEQPLPADALDEMSTLRADSPIRIAADESATSEANVMRVIDAGAADVIVIKPSAAGGPFSAVRIARVARRANLDVVVTSMLDGAVAAGAALQVAALLAGEGETPACGLATSNLFEHNITPLPSVLDGRVHLSLRPGIGLDVKRASFGPCLVGPAIEVLA